MEQEIKSWICRKCDSELPVGRFRIRQGVRGQFYIDNICKACRGKAECARLRLEMLEALGWKCACCGESHPQLLTLEHINGQRGFYGRRYGRSENTRQSNTYVEIRKAKREGWDRTKWELLCMSCNHAKGHYGQCPHRTGVTREQVIEQLKQDSAGIGLEYRNSMVEGSKATRYTEGNPRPDLIGNTYAAKKVLEIKSEVA
jgi:hypothetical protein